MTTPLYHAIASTRPLLRVGVLLDHWVSSAWIGEVLASVKASGVAELTTVVLNQEHHSGNRQSRGGFGGFFEGRMTPLNTLLWRLYVRVDEIVRPFFATPFQPTNLEPLLAGANRIKVTPVRRDSIREFGAADVQSVRDERLDVILRFGFNILHGDVLEAATYGVWSYHHGDNHEYRGGPAGFWEMYGENPLTGTILQILTEKLDAGRVIFRTQGATRSFESLLVNRYWLYRKAIPFVSRCLRRVYEHGPAGLCPEPDRQGPLPPIRRTPRNSRMIRFLFRGLWRIMKERVRRLSGIKTGHWFLGVARDVTPGESLRGRVEPVYPPKGRFWADPILTTRKGRPFLFFEDYDYRSGLGRISVSELDSQGRPGAVHAALEADHHLSYPFVFEWQGDHFMIPETASVRAVQLFRAIDFPERWEFVKDLLTDVRAVDATLCEHENSWYLFTSVSESGGSSWDELFCFVSDSPLGPWLPHAMNPIVSDVRCARPGGPIFRQNGRLFRPAQNSAQLYGHSLTVMEITELTRQRFAERPAFDIEPDWLPGIRGCHTITMAGDLVVLDCRTRKWLP
ncbi:MAG: hypothetical protein ABI718_04000 [Acidobacteriota bacterium]